MDNDEESQRFFWSCGASSLRPAEYDGSRATSSRRVRLVLVVGEESVKVELRVLHEGSEPGHPRYGQTQVTKLVKALAASTADRSPSRWSPSIWLEGTRSYPRAGNDTRAEPPNPRMTTCFCGQNNKAWRWCHGSSGGTAQEIADAVVESWFVSRHTSDRVATVMLMPGNDDGEDGAFRAATQRGGGGRALLRRLLMPHVLSGPLGELPDVMGTRDRVEAVRLILHHEESKRGEYLYN